MATIHNRPERAAMQDYSISKSTRRCAISGRSLEPGECYFSMIVADGEDVARVDVAASDWQGPNEAAIGWWRNKMPSVAARKLRPAPNAVLLDTLCDLLERPNKSELAYLLALLLVRRRVLQEEQNFSQADIESRASSSTSDANGSHGGNAPMDVVPDQLWKLVSTVDGRELIVPLAAPTTESIQTLQAELQTLLFTDQ
ncbi:MAG: hypothetical protein KDA51_09095 [Planctomycetales bacterium]|nr:hypothetical protein [Planctomycetales bacterium]